MGLLKENKLPMPGKVVSVCPEVAPRIVESDEFGFLAGETLVRRATRLDSELERSRGDLGARGEPRHIEISRSNSQLEQGSAAMNNRSNVACEIIDAVELAKRWKVPETWVRDQVRRRSLDPIPHVRLGKYVRFEWGGEPLNDWWSRRRRSPNRAGLRAG